jgi:hypothetical protein
MAGSFFAQSGKKTNLEILEQDLTAEIEKLLYYPDVNRELQFVCYISPQSNDNSEKKFVESLLKKAAEKNKLKLSFAKDESMASGDSVYNKLKVNIIKIQTNYPALGKNKFLGEKTIKREISSELVVSISTGTGRVIVDEKVSTIYKDEIPYDDYERYQSEEYLFTQSVPPDISWLETIIFPAAVVVVSAVVTILFFTIRSK